ncbi:MAG: hypothetical protein J6N52_06790 [Clostridia bacterium]|nr:hypothetical protein [Clostridia bacterium]
MKKWQRICLIIVIVAGILSGTGYGVYKVAFEPKVEQALERAQTVLNNEAFQDEIDKFVQEMIESGALQDADIQNYVQFKTSRDEKKNVEAAGGEADSSSTAAPETKPAPANPAPAKPAPKATAPPATAKPAKSKKLIDRVKEAMTPEEFSFAMSIYNKLDVGYITSNMNSKREEVKAYVKSVLSSSEISRCIDIYGKYSYLLSE